ncbi:hypothetical protein SAMN03080594_1111, partial [Arenibacter palladensis]
MKNHPNLFYYSASLLFVLFLNSSCTNDSDLLVDYVNDNNQEETDITEEENPNETNKEDQSSKTIPSDFDWSNIPVEFGDSMWLIKEEFDLGGTKVSLPDNVTLNFDGGVLKNGSLEGNGTTIEPTNAFHIFNSVELTGNFSNEYLKPIWFGAFMDGISDD